MFTRLLPFQSRLILRNTRNIMSTNSPQGKWNPNLTPDQLYVLKDKGTEKPDTGKYLHNKDTGVYYCANCHSPLYSSEQKFESGCGWPAFYEEIKPGSLKYIKDEFAGMTRTEVCCNNCGGHLGHVFEGEGWQKVLGIPKDIRHCVNSLSLTFEKDDKNN